LRSKIAKPITHACDPLCKPVNLKYYEALRLQGRLLKDVIFSVFCLTVTRVLLAHTACPDPFGVKRSDAL